MEERSLNEKNYEQNETEIKVNQIVEQIKKDVDVKQLNNIDWWKKLPRGQRFYVGDIVYLPEINKYAVVNGPARKEGLMRIVVLKKDLSKGFYNREWYVSIDELQLVRRHFKTDKNFICVYNRFYKIQK